MAKCEVLGGETDARSEEKPHKAYKQLDHPVRLGGILAPTTNRKSLYNRQYGVFTRDRLDNALIAPGLEVAELSGPVLRRERLGGMLSYYHRKAA